jgi:hypothetical protein
MSKKRIFPNNVGRRSRIHAINGDYRYFRVEDEIAREQPVIEKLTKKLIYFQIVRFEDNDELEYRFTYYMLGLKPGAKGRWMFGQYSLLVPADILRQLLAEARKRKWEGI